MNVEHKGGKARQRKRNEAHKNGREKIKKEKEETEVRNGGRR